MIKQVTEVLRGGAAWDSGFVEIGDVLLRVDGKNVTSCSMVDMQTLIIGEEGSEVVLEFARGDKPFMLPIKRKVIRDLTGGRGVSGLTMDDALFSEIDVPAPPRPVGQSLSCCRCCCSSSSSSLPWLLRHLAYQSMHAHTPRLRMR